MAQIFQSDRTDLTVHIGTELYGVKPEKLTDQDIEDLKTLIAERGLVVFRDLELTIPDQVRLGRRLGTLLLNPLPAAPVEGFPEIYRIETGSDRRSTDPGAEWHTDQSFWESPPAISILRIDTQPPVGGDTVFTSMYGAYEALSPTMQKFVDTLTVLHSGVEQVRKHFGKDTPTDGMEAVHPMVRTHPISGKKALYVNSAYAKRIVELEEKESAALLHLLFDHIAYAVPSQVRLRWDRGTVAIWDNRCVLHAAVWDYYPQTRIGFRVMTTGERPFLKA
jgi:alpha-ketoglutarate-dependent taurine dioxygenase